MSFRPRLIVVLFGHPPHTLETHRARVGSLTRRFGAPYGHPVTCRCETDILIGQRLYERITSNRGGPARGCTGRGAGRASTGRGYGCGCIDRGAGRGDDGGARHGGPSETTALYPFPFRFDVVYTLLSDTLSVAYEIHNPGEGMLYASCGGHDSFALSEEVGEYALRFASEERLDSYLTDDEGRLTGRTQSLGQGRVLDLSTPLLDGGGSVCLDHLRSREVTLVRRTSGETVARVAFPETDKLVLWHPAGSRMLCIEPWQTLPDTVGDTRDFSAKDGVLAVPAGQTRCVTRRITYGDGT